MRLSMPACNEEQLFCHFILSTCQVSVATEIQTLQIIFFLIILKAYFCEVFQLYKVWSTCVSLCRFTPCVGPEHEPVKLISKRFYV